MSESFEPIERSAGRRRILPADQRGSHTGAEWRTLLDVTGHRCLCCGATGVKLTKDHIRPVSRAGMNTISNLQSLCGPCNVRKGARWIDYRDEATRAQFGEMPSMNWRRGRRRKRSC